MAKDATPTVGPDGTCFKIPEQVPEKVHDLEFDGWEIIILKLYEIVILRDTTYFQTLHIQKKWQCGNVAMRQCLNPMAFPMIFGRVVPHIQLVRDEHMSPGLSPGCLEISGGINQPTSE